MSREQVAQQPPAPGIIRLGARFPKAWLEVTDVVARVHSADLDAGWYSSSMQGRFDLAAPRGTCYAADTIAAAFRESLGVVAVGGHVPRADAEARAVTLLTGIRDRFAAVSDPGAAAFGITSELTSMTPYATPQAWAQEFDEVGFGGVRYASRFTPGPATAWAIFGPTGAHPVGVVKEVISGTEACARAGLRVLPDPPKSAELTKLSPPRPTEEE